MKIRHPMKEFQGIYLARPDEKTLLTSDAMQRRL